MAARMSIVAYVFFAILGVFGAHLAGLFEEADLTGETTGAELLRAVLGFFLLLGSLVGLLFVFLQKRRPMTLTDISRWEVVKEKGKRAYVRSAMLKGMLLGFVAIAWPLIGDLKARALDHIVDSLWMYIAIVLICVVASCYAAMRSWNANERGYEAIFQSTPQREDNLKG